MAIFNVLKGNWKKSVFLSVLFGCGVYSAKSYYDIQTHMRRVCCEAANYGDKVDKQLPRRILVVINPVANNSKSEKHFKKFCEPILHLAGFTIDSVKTCYVGHAKAYIENTKFMPDAIVVAGGAGTASEVITGLMRREKSSCPIAILPLGVQNNKGLFGKVDYIKILTNSVMHMINGTIRLENVMKYESLENFNENVVKKRPIYGFNCFQWGVLRDLNAIKENYWYFGNFKRQAAEFFNSFADNLSWKCSANVIYTPPCSGCNNCFQNVTAPKNNLLNYLNKNKSYNRNNIINDNCAKTIRSSIHTSQLTITPHCKSENLCELVAKQSKRMDPGFDFLLNRFRNIETDSILPINSRTIQLIPTSPCQNKFYSIDGEDYEVHPIKISLILKAIQVFTM